MRSSSPRPCQRKVASDRHLAGASRQDMKGVCLNCHNHTYVDNFYKQFDDLVVLYNDKFAKPAQQLMNDLQADGVLNPKAPFEHEVQWVF